MGEPFNHGSSVGNIIHLLPFLHSKHKQKSSKPTHFKSSAGNAQLQDIRAQFLFPRWSPASFQSTERGQKNWHDRAGFKGKEAVGGASVSSVLPPPYSNRNDPSWWLQMAQVPPHQLSSFLPSLGLRQVSSSIKLYKTHFTSMISCYFVWIAALFISFGHIVIFLILGNDWERYDNERTMCTWTSSLPFSKTDSNYPLFLVTTFNSIIFWSRHYTRAMTNSNLTIFLRFFFFCNAVSRPGPNIQH